MTETVMAASLKDELKRMIDDLPVSFAGNGYLAGSFPDGITTLNGVPVAATVRVHYRPEEGVPGDGVLVASTESGADGTWRIDGLNPTLKYDIISRLDGQNDVIAANVQPVASGG